MGSQIFECCCKSKHYIHPKDLKDINGAVKWAAKLKEIISEVHDCKAWPGSFHWSVLMLEIDDPTTAAFLFFFNCDFKAPHVFDNTS